MPVKDGAVKDGAGAKTPGQAVPVPAAFLDDVRALLDGFDALSDPLDALGAAQAETDRDAAASEARIGDALETLRERTGPVLGLDVTGPMGQIAGEAAYGDGSRRRLAALVGEANAAGLNLADAAARVASGLGAARAAQDAPASSAPPDLTTLIGQTVQVQGEDGTHTVTGVAPDRTLIVAANADKPPSEAAPPSPTPAGDGSVTSSTQTAPDASGSPTPDSPSPGADTDSGTDTEQDPAEPGA